LEHLRYRIDGAWPELNDSSWLSGVALFDKLEDYDYQFVWGVLSAFPKGTTPILSGEPFADGNDELWSDNPKKQMENSLFEIVCWDSSATLFIGLDTVLANNLIKNAPSIVSLVSKNEK